ncbi:MAG TPA: MBL fold metallo-hydrolase [Longimicrobium sp.]|nr:MBL fold metallo-hydrolase [Longimicrobium sp.]
MPFEESPGIHRIDLNWNGHPGQVASYLVDGGDALAVVETGPTSTLGAVLDGIRAIGREPAEVTHILVTHVHLDHAGGAGALLRHAPNARVHVHPRGATHLADPSRLIASATQLYGELMDTLWGEMAAVPEDRLVILHDGDEVRAGTRRLRAVDTPGHAVHHHAYHDPDAGMVFTGDVAGIRVQRLPYVTAPTPPPDIDLDAWHRSIARLRELSPSLLLLTHFGGVDDAEWHLDDLAARLRGWETWTGEQAASGVTGPALAAATAARATSEILQATGSQAAADAYELTVPYPMMAAGLERWWKKHRAARPADGGR